jgi:3-hydroxybutyryl-CoA dehydratase
MSYIRQKANAGMRIGDSITVSRTFTAQDALTFADIRRDYNPVHFDDRFAQVKNFQGRICHGLLVASILTEVGGQIGCLASGMNFVFKKPVYFGDTIACHFTITALDERNRAKARDYPRLARIRVRCGRFELPRQACPCGGGVPAGVTGDRAPEQAARKVPGGSPPGNLGVYQLARAR